MVHVSKPAKRNSFLVVFDNQALFVSPGKPESCRLLAASPNQYDKNFFRFCFTFNTDLDTKYSRAHGACFCEELTVLEILNAMNLGCS